MVPRRRRGLKCPDHTSPASKRGSLWISVVTILSLSLPPRRGSANEPAAASRPRTTCRPCLSKPRSRRRTADPFLGLWDGEIRPMLEATPGLRPVTLLEEMQRRYPDHDWDRLRRSRERRVRAWSAERSGLFRLGACRVGARRRELHSPRCWSA